MQGDRLKLLFLFTYLKCRLCHCCPRSGSLLHSAWKPKSSRWPWSALCALNTQGCDLLPLLLPLLIPFQSHGLSSPDQGMANSFTILKSSCLVTLYQDLCQLLLKKLSSTPMTGQIDATSIYSLFFLRTIYHPLTYRILFFLSVSPSRE